MKNFTVYDKEGKILRTGLCQKTNFLCQAHEDEFVIEGKANSATQKIVKGKIVDKTSGEIEEDDNVLPPEVPENKKLAHITNEQWQNVLSRLKNLEKET